MTTQNQNHYQTLTLPIATIIAVIVEQLKNLPASDHPDKPGQATYLAIMAQTTEQLTRPYTTHQGNPLTTLLLACSTVLLSPSRKLGRPCIDYEVMDAYLAKQKAKQEATSQAQTEPTQQPQPEPDDEQGD